MKNLQKIKDYPPSELDAPVNNINVDDLTVVIPVLNEEEGIGKVIELVKREGYHNILVVDGYSIDRTVSIANKNGVNVIFQDGVGKTGALQTAINHVKTPYLIVMDGDCTYHPKYIKYFLPQMVYNDQVIGVRFFGRENIPIFNRFGNLLINLIFNMLHGTRLTDVCSGMYALRTSIARNLDLRTRGFDVEVEIAAKISKKGKISQVPINYYERVGQQKLIPWKHGLQILFSIIKLRGCKNSFKNSTHFKDK